MLDNERIEDRSTAPFNMALRTLEKIHNLLSQIAIVSSIVPTSDNPYNLTKGKSQHVKYYLIRQLFIQGVPLIEKKDAEQWKKLMNSKIRKLREKLMTSGVYQNNKLVRVEERFDPVIDDILDDIMMEIENRLQAEGYFMPPKYDARYSWKQE